MKDLPVFKTVILFLVVIGVVIILSNLSGRIWGGKSESLPAHWEWTIEEGMRVADFGRANELTNPVLKEIFGLQSREDLQKKLSAYGTADQIEALVVRRLALVAEQGSKNWVKILIKFALWFVFLTTVFFLFNRRKAVPTLRKWLLFTSVLVFGVVMGSDPGPMGTVKDAIHLFGSTGAIFPPRMIALAVFLLLVFLANKYICAWGCQAGALQDLVFRLNQGNGRKASLGRQVRLPFVVTNSVRIAFFCIFTLVAFLWGTDIVEPVDPFKIFKPAALGLIGGSFVGLLLILSLFVYRPWCHLLCPFGLVGWLVEKVSRVRISVDYETCIACRKCEAACPSTVMGAILTREKKTIPDCFACYACRDVCPTESIQFSTRKRTLSPPGHFKEKKAS